MYPRSHVIGGFLDLKLSIFWGPIHLPGRSKPKCPMAHRRHPHPPFRLQDLASSKQNLGKMSSIPFSQSSAMRWMPTTAVAMKNLEKKHSRECIFPYLLRLQPCLLRAALLFFLASPNSVQLEVFRCHLWGWVPRSGRWFVGFFLLKSSAHQPRARKICKHLLVNQLKPWQSCFQWSGEHLFVA